MVKSIKVTLKELDNNEGSGGLEIYIPGTVGDPSADDPKNALPIFIEYYKGELRLLLWNGDSDPEIYKIGLKKKAKKGTK
jgi:hypothetical protein